MKFYVGIGQPSDAKNFERCCISVRRLLPRKAALNCPEVFVDSAAFTELNLYGEYRFTVRQYARELHRLHVKGVANIIAAASQDYMCEPFILKKTGLTVLEHQKRTIRRYDKLLKELGKLFKGGIPFRVVPVLQGFRPEEYKRHIEMYGDRLEHGMWVGVGSVCKRNSTPIEVLHVLATIKRARPDLELHGFGIKKTSLKNNQIRNYLASADSMAWSWAARRQGRNQNDWQEARNYVADVLSGNTASNKLFWR